MPDYCGGDFQALLEQALKELEFMIWGYGVENIVIGMFQQLLHYCTHNSCKIWDYGAENVLIGVLQKLLHYYTHR